MVTFNFLNKKGDKFELLFNFCYKSRLDSFNL